MYGLVNKAIRDHVSTQHGEESWQEIRERAGTDVDVFILNETYPEELTHDLLAAAAGQLKISPAELLTGVGRQWVLDTAGGPFGSIITSCGNCLKDFLTHLPSMHTRIAMIFPNLDPPRFACTHTGPGAAVLHYQSPRPGLSPFIAGMIHGAADHFGDRCTVTPVESKGDGADRHAFEVKWTVNR